MVQHGFFEGSTLLEAVASGGSDVDVLETSDDSSDGEGDADGGNSDDDMGIEGDGVLDENVALHLACKFCDRPLCNRGMPVYLVVDASKTLFSTDLVVRLLLKHSYRGGLAVATYCRVMLAVAIIHKRTTACNS